MADRSICDYWRFNVAVRFLLCTLTAVFATLAAPGCLRPEARYARVDRGELERKARDCLKAAIGYQHNPVVRVEAVEALEITAIDETLPWIRSALTDAHPAVRSAACLALGHLRDKTAEGLIRRRLEDQDANVKVAALFALHQLGHTERTGKLATYLLQHEDVAVRRNAALALGLLGEKGAIKVLARAMRDADAGVRHHALEAMARLGNREARQELAFMANAGVGSEEVFAIGALMETGDPVYLDTFRYKLATATHLETRLAAARGLGVLEEADGLELALRSLRARRTLMDDPKDPPDAQQLRASQMAAAALGAIGRVEALPVLTHLMENSDDPRVVVSAAKAILRILARTRAKSLPFATDVNGRR